jgi:ribose/xylose/arabinose/galactoside ABC-type transport system permease subunit
MRNKIKKVAEKKPATPRVVTPQKTESFFNVVRQLVGRFGLVIVLFLLITALSFLSPYFLKEENLFNILLQAAINLIIALGMTYVIATGGIDLSVGSIVGLSGMAMAKLLIAGVSLPVALSITLFLGMTMGTINGLLITRIGLPPFIATLGTMSVYRGLALIINDGRPAYGLSAKVLQVISGRLGPIPIPVIISLVAAAIAFFVMKRTVIGEYTLAIGGNEEAVRLSGVPVARYKTIVYLISGLMCAVAGIVLTARLTAAEPIAGTGYELDAIAATVIGGTSLSGGVATIPGTLIGALIMSVLRNGLNLLNIQSYYQLVAIGLVIVLAVAIDKIRKS